MLAKGSSFYIVRTWWVSTGLFFIAFLICGFFNRPASDDLEFLRVLDAEGIAGAAAFFRDTWNTRWVSILWLNCWLRVYEKTGSLLPYHLTTLLLLVFSTYYFLVQILRHCLTVQLPKASLWLLAACFAAALFYASFSISDTWFWINTSTMYGWSHIYALLAAGIILSSKAGIAGYLLLVVCGMGIGGGNEPFALTTILITICLLSLFITRYRSGNHFIFPLLVLLGSTAMAFGISYTGTGHSVRSSLLPDLSMTEQLWVLTKSMIKLFLIHIPGKLPALFLLLAPFFYLGSQYNGVINVRNILKYTSLLFIVLSIIAIVPLVVIMSEMGPERAWSQVSLYLTCFIAILLLVTGYYYRLRFNAVRTIRIFGMLSIAYVVATGTSAIFTAKAYSERWDERMQYLKTEIKNPENTSIEVRPLPESGWLHSAEITNDPDHFTNRHLRQYLKASVPIILKSPERGN